MSDWFSKQKKPLEIPPGVAPPFVVPVPVPQPVGTARILDPNGKVLTTQLVRELTKHFEGLVLVATDDGYGTPTYGYGRILHPDGSKVRNGDDCTEMQAEEWLDDDFYGEGMRYVRAFLNDDVEAEMSDSELAVWGDITFNRGCGRFREYLAPLLNARNRAGAMKVMVSTPFVTAAGRYSLGLDRRRWAERFILEGKDWHALDTIAKFQAFKERGYTNE